MIKRIITLLLCQLLLTFSISAQNNFESTELYGLAAERVMAGAEHVWLKQENSIPTFIKFRDNYSLTEEQFLFHIKKQFNLPSTYTFKNIGVESDQLGFTHKRFQVLVNGVAVENGIFILHIRGGRVEKYNGYIFKSIPTTTPTLTEDAALTQATKAVGASVYKWNLPEEEAFIKIEQNNPTATFYPAGHLVIQQKDGDNKSSNFILCWKFDIYAHAPMGRYNVYINALTGEVVKKENKICTVDAGGTATTVYRGVRSFTTDNTGSSYRLREASRGSGIRTYNMRTGTSYGAAVDFTDADNNWNNVNPAKDQYAPDAHWGAEKTYDFYLSKGRNSIDNAGYLLNLYVHYDVDYDNAYWDGTRMTFGDGGSYFGYKPLVSLDITGHEVSHGLDQYTANLDYLNESGALNESFSDIFGTAVEFYADSTYNNWTMGEDLVTGGIRSMASQNPYGNPDTYLGTNWYTGSADNGGVHTNSGVQNFWYYLLAAGGTGTNDNGDAYTVIGQGRTKATDISWRNMVVYLTNTSDYADARFYAIQSATDLYGACTAEVIATTNAWHAVGVGAAFVAGVDAQFSNSSPIGCAAPFTVNFTNLSVNASSYIWYFGDGDTSSATNPSHVYTSLGLFTVRLIAYGGACGTDSIIYTNLVNISTLNPCEVVMPSSGTGTTQTTCTGTVYDNGGRYGAYTDNVNSNITIAPTGASSVTLTFTRFRMENTYDFLYVYNGPSTASPLIGTYTGYSLPATISSTVGSITLRQSTDPSVVDTGFAINWTCTSSSVPPVVKFIGLDSNTCSGTVDFTDKSTGGASAWLWNFGDASTSTLQNPTHTYLTNGTYTVSLQVTNSAGTSTLTKTGYIVVNKPAAPTGVNGTRCGTGTVSISATTSNAVKWYTSSTSTSSVSSSNPYTTPSISSTTNYYVEELIPQTTYNAGPATNAFGTGGNFNGDRRWGLRFRVNKNSILESVYVYAQGSGYRTIQYRDTGGAVIATRSVYIPNGGSRVTLNISLTPGLWELGVQDSMNLYRNNSGASYPYNDAGGYVSIISTNLPSTTSGYMGYYYYFYNWIVRGPDCVSLRRTVVATVNPNPTITSTTPRSRCGTGTVSLGATASSGTLNWYAAASGGSSLGTGTTYTTPSLSSTTTYYVEAISSAGCLSGRTAVIATINPLPTITGTTPGSRCGTGTVTIGATTSSGTVDWYSTPTGGTSIGTGTSFTTPSIAITTTYYAQAVSSAGCNSAVRTAVVATVNPIPTITGTTPATRCGPGTVTLSATASSGATINWYAAATGGTSLSTGASFTSPSLTATTTYYVEATSSAGCKSTRTAVVATVNIVIPTISLSGNDTICPGQTVNLTATSAGTAYVWSPGGETTSSITVGSTGTYSVSVTSACGGSSAPITITSIPTVVPIINISGNDTICTGGSTVLNATPTGSSYTYQWSTGSLAPSITVTSGGPYTVSVTSVCGTNSSPVTITEITPPIAGFSQIASGLSVSFNNSTSGANDRWLWNFGDGGSSTLQNPTHVYASAGTYTVTLTSGNGVCNNTITISVTVTQNPNGIKEIDILESVTVYPNPANDFINVDLSKMKSSPYHLSLSNSLGELLIDNSIKDIDISKPYTLLIKSLSAGVYYLKVETTNRTQFVQKVIIEKQ